MDPMVTLPLNAKSAKTLLDTMQIPHVLYKKMIVMKYDQVEYMLYHCTIYDAIKELLSNVDILKHCIFDYKPKYVRNDKGDKERCYRE